MFYVYILRSKKDGSYYVGYTSHLQKRVERHNQGRSKYTKGKVPLYLVYYKKFQTKREAMKMEKLIKSFKGGEAFKTLINTKSA